MAHRERGGEKVTLVYPQVREKRRRRVLAEQSNIQISPLFFFALVVQMFLFLLAVARFEIQHDAVVNHVCMSGQLCQAESECPLLARVRPASSSGEKKRVQRELNVTVARCFKKKKQQH